MSVSGSGSYFAFNGLIAQSGNLADGALVISGGSYNFAAFDTAVNTGAGPGAVAGSIMLTAGADVHIEDLFGDAARGAGFPLRATVGRAYDADHSAYGLLSVNGGADLTLAPQAVYQPGIGVYGGYDTLNAGVGAGGSGRVEVSGASSSLRTEGANPLIRIGGAGGDATFAVNGGATAGLFALQAGFGVGTGSVATGRIEVSGTGSRLTLGSSYGAYIRPAYSGMSGTATIGLAFADPAGGVTGRGYLDITAGGEVVVETEPGITDFPFLRFGRDAPSYGSGLVDGAGSRLAVVQHGAVANEALGGATLDIGGSGEGQLTVRNGGRVEVLGDRAQLSVARPIPGQPVTTSTSRLDVESGGLVLVDGGSYAGGLLVVGNGASSQGAASVTGAGALIRVVGDAPDQGGAQLIIGSVGVGTLLATAGGRVELAVSDDPNGRVIVGADGGHGALTIDGGDLAVLGGTLGGAVPRILIGSGSGSTGSVTVTGSGVLDNLAADGVTLIAGASGETGSLIVSGIGSEARPGILTLVGAGLDAGGAILPVDGGDGSLAIRNGGTVSGGTVVVGTSGQIELTNSELASGLELHGRLTLSPGILSSETLRGPVLFHSGNTVSLDVDAFSQSATDQIVFTGSDPVAVDSLAVSLTIDGELDFFAGDSFVFAIADVPFVGSGSDFVDPSSGRILRLAVDNTALSIEALQGTPVTLRQDGSIQSVELPSAEPYFDAPGQLPGQGGPLPGREPFGPPPGLGAFGGLDPLLL